MFMKKVYHQVHETKHQNPWCVLPLWRSSQRCGGQIPAISPAPLTPRQTSVETRTEGPFSYLGAKHEGVKHNGSQGRGALMIGILRRLFKRVHCKGSLVRIPANSGEIRKAIKIHRNSNKWLKHLNCDGFLSQQMSSEFA